MGIALVESFLRLIFNLFMFPSGLRASFLQRPTGKSEGTKDSWDGITSDLCRIITGSDFLVD